MEESNENTTFHLISVPKVGVAQLFYFYLRGVEVSCIREVTSGIYDLRLGAARSGQIDVVEKFSEALRNESAIGDKNAVVSITFIEYLVHWQYQPWSRQKVTFAMPIPFQILHLFTIGTRSIVCKWFYEP